MANEARISNDTDEHESADYYVCVRADDGPAHFTDDLYDFCCECGEKVRYRPHGPVAPKKICLQCVLPSMVEAKARGDLEVVTSDKSAAEFKAKTGKILRPSDALDAFDKKSQK